MKGRTPEFDASSFLNGLEKVSEEIQEHAAEGLLAAAEHVLNTSNERVPHQDGDLERSGAASMDVETLTAAVSYDTPYAVRQHEDTSFAHDDGRQAKFLETALNDERDRAAEYIAQKIREGLGL